MHIKNPVTQAVHNKLKHVRRQHVQGISAAGVVDVMAGRFRIDTIVRNVIDAAE